MVSGFMMIAGPGGPAAPTLVVTEALKVYAGGREERLRNGESTGLTAATFKEIVAASETGAVYASPVGPQSPLPIPMPFPIPGLEELAHGFPTSYSVPSVLFGDVSLRAPRGERPRRPVVPHPFKGR